ncbi:hypothetical protein EZV62_010717 [Acer yangbiense]|uniref:Uncharacterized protein n=1 Tax=Acer yangbiense TaxID=1000413 RepID=A0A5C7I2J2_9ROSI|nr:hypothetical protein EZV62_010717 [Acer yangbiense]
MGQLAVTIENCTKVMLGWNSSNRVSLRSSILRYQGEFCRIYSPKLREDIMQVSQLRMASGGWNGQLIQELFDENEAEAILSIPASSNLRSDSVCWHYTSDGEYSVRSGYKL